MISPPSGVKRSPSLKVHCFITIVSTIDFPQRESTHDYTRGRNHRSEGECGVEGTVSDLFNDKGERLYLNWSFDGVFTGRKWDKFRHCLRVLCKWH